jgi:LysR family transcriptional regulator, glycine cleavage system transcriptional activator
MSTYRVTHLRSLQALEMAIREGSLKSAAQRLGITQAALGQRIRMLETYLGTDLILRGRSGIQPTAELSRALEHLQEGFSALERATEVLDFQRGVEIHIVADPDWADFWLLPRLPAFRAVFPRVLFCVNGTGDVPLRLGAPDLRVTLSGGNGEALFHERFAPVCGPDNLRRVIGPDGRLTMEGMPLLHLAAQIDPGGPPGWVNWLEAFGQNRPGPDRGIRFRRLQDAYEAARREVGFLVCGLSLVLGDLDNTSLVIPFPAESSIVSDHPYRAVIRAGADQRPQFQRFMDWLRDEARKTDDALLTITAGRGRTRSGRRPRH